VWRSFVLIFASFSEIALELEAEEVVATTQNNHKDDDEVQSRCERLVDAMSGANWS
jgi:hypothetical protein